MKAYVSLIAPHGMTDLFSHPLPLVLKTHAATALLCSYPKTRPLLLAIVSVSHLGNDFHSLAASFAIHLLWVIAPKTCLPYLAFFHTPLHYSRCKPPILLFTVFTLIAYLSFESIQAKMNSLFGKYWWVAPVSGHVLLNSHQMY